MFLIFTENDQYLYNLINSSRIFGIVRLFLMIIEQLKTFLRQPP